MGKNLENFEADLKEIQIFLSNRKKLGDLASNAGVGATTVNDTFKVKSFDELIGKKLDVYRCAINMVNEIKLLPKQASDSVK